jgi:hypothetical protein
MKMEKNAYLPFSDINIYLQPSSWFLDWLFLDCLTFEYAGTTFLCGMSGTNQPTTMHHIPEVLNPQADLYINDLH